MNFVRGFLIAGGGVFFFLVLLIGGIRGISEDPWNTATDSWRFRAYDFFLLKHRVATLVGLCIYLVSVVVCFWKEIRSTAFRSEGISGMYWNVMVLLAVIVIAIMFIFE